MTLSPDDVDALLQLDPLKMVTIASKDESLFDKLKEFSSKLAQHVESMGPKVVDGNGAKANKRHPDEKEEEESNVPPCKRQKLSLTRCAEKTEEDILRYDLAVAHRLTAKLGMDMLVWNHISARFKAGCLITPGRQMWGTINPSDLVFTSSNITADIIHAAVYGARPDVKAIIHLHTPAATAVSCLESGFVPFTQDSSYFYNKVANYEWDGVSNEACEGHAIVAAVRAVPNCNTLLMHNHGFVCFGSSVKEVWVLAYYFERSCQVQLDLLKTGAKIKLPSEMVMEKAAETSYLPEFAPGACEWEALCKEVSFDE